MVLEKKSQVTIYMTLGVVLVATFTLMYLTVYQARTTLKSQVEPYDVSDVKGYVDSCLEFVSNWGIDWALFQLGTYEQFDAYSTAMIPIVTEPSGIGLPDGSITRSKDFNKDMIRDSIGIFFNDTFGICIKDFEDFEQYDHNITYQEPNLDVTVGDHSIILELDFPITVKSKDTSQSYDKFLYRKNIEIKEIIDITNDIIDESVRLNRPPTQLELDELQNTHEDLAITITHLYEGWPETVLVEYILGFKNSKYRVAFIISYDWFNPAVPPEAIPSLDDIFAPA
ncbi:hypothetical protein JYT91_01010 [archaeon AH-315-M20]|nr:hypothetical protein [archaeon AH-315-M20]